MRGCIMEERFYTYKRVGYFKERMAENLGVKFTGTIYASRGVIKHIKKRHGKQLGKISLFISGGLCICGVVAFLIKSSMATHADYYSLKGIGICGNFIE